MIDEKIVLKTFLNDTNNSRVMPRTAVINTIIFGEKMISRMVDVGMVRFAGNIIGHICAACVGVQKPEDGDKYIGYGAIILPVDKNNGFLHPELVYGKRFTPYFLQINNDIQGKWSYDRAYCLYRSWGDLIRKNDQFEESSFYYYLNTIFSDMYSGGFRYCIIESICDTKSECVQQAINSASLYMQAINSLIEERMTNLTKGNK